MSEIKITTIVEYEGKSKTFRGSFPDVNTCKKWIFGLNPDEQYGYVILGESIASANLCILNILKKNMTEEEIALINWDGAEKYDLE